MIVRLTDGGDGSTFVMIRVDENSAPIYLNPDIPHDGSIIFTIEDGKVVDEVEEFD